MTKKQKDRPDDSWWWPLLVLGIGPYLLAIGGVMVGTVVFALSFGPESIREGAPIVDVVVLAWSALAVTSGIPAWIAWKNVRCPKCRIRMTVHEEAPIAVAVVSFLFGLPPAPPRLECPRCVRVAPLPRLRNPDPWALVCICASAATAFIIGHRTGLWP